MYPIGRFEQDKVYSFANTQAHIQIISALPSKFINVVSGLEESQLETPYRPEGWTVRQTIHHVADSHIHAYMRFKRATTEQNPDVTGYDQDLWANLNDGKSAPVEWSLKFLQYLHLRWVLFMTSLTESDLKRTYYHTGYNRSFTLQEAIALYAWHSEHHYEHINQLCIREGWR